MEEKQILGLLKGVFRTEFNKIGYGYSALMDNVEITENMIKSTKEIVGEFKYKINPYTSLCGDNMICFEIYCEHKPEKIIERMLINGNWGIVAYTSLNEVKEYAKKEGYYIQNMGMWGVFLFSDGNVIDVYREVEEK